MSPNTSHSSIQLCLEQWDCSLDSRSVHGCMFLLWLCYAAPVRFCYGLIAPSKESFQMSISKIYSLHTFLTSVLDGDERSAWRPGRFTSGLSFPRYPLNRRLGGPQSRSAPIEDERNLLLQEGIQLPFPWRPSRSLGTHCTGCIVSLPFRYWF
jgi:hypothetical protein